MPATDGLYLGQIGDVVLAGTPPPDGASLTAPGADIKFYDSDGDGLWSVGDPAIRDVNGNYIYDVGVDVLLVGDEPYDGAPLISSHPYLHRFYDANGNGVWDVGEPAIKDVDGDDKYTMPRRWDGSKLLFRITSPLKFLVQCKPFLDFTDALSISDTGAVSINASNLIMSTGQQALADKHIQFNLYYDPGMKACFKVSSGEKDYLVIEDGFGTFDGLYTRNWSPVADNTFDFGSPVNRWRKGYFAQGVWGGSPPAKVGMDAITGDVLCTNLLRDAETGGNTLTVAQAKEAYDLRHNQLHASSHEKGGVDVLGVVTPFKFGAEGATTTSTVYVTIANSDIAFNPALFKLKATLYVKLIYHIKNDTAAKTTYIRVLRQNAGTVVSGSEASVVGAGWGIVETAWIDWSGESGNESYQLQMKVTGGLGEFNSALMVLSPVQL